jgi:tricarballylate dehydrogenase
MPIPTGRPNDRYDVIVLGSGLAGTAAALAAWDNGASVLVVEKAPRESAGGNTRFSGGGFRIPRSDYSPDDFFEDLMIVTKGRGNKELLRNMTRRAQEDTDWLQGHGLVFGDQTKTTLKHREHVGPRRQIPTWAKPVPFQIDGFTQNGCGNGVVQQLLPTVIDKVDFVVDTKAERLLVDDLRHVVGVRTFNRERGYQDIGAGAVVVATGGFQANQEMRSRYFGAEAAHWRVRGTRFNTGDGIRMAMDIGAAPVGDFADIHCAVIDARSRPVEGGSTNVNTYPFGIIVNANGERFLDEGEDYRDRTYAKFGKKILAQPGSVAHLIFDEKLVDNMACYVLEWGPISAPTLKDLAALLEIDAQGLERTVQEFNAAITKDVPFNTQDKDGRAARGIKPEKSNWAVEIDTPPYYAFTVTGGVTFTFAGLRTNVKGEVISTEEYPIPGLYAAGEIQGDFFYYNYPGGSSLIRCSVYGRAAGTNAAAWAHSGSRQPVA